MSMAELNLTESALGRARRDTSQAYKSSSFMVGAALVAILAGAVAAAVSSGEDVDVLITAAVICGVGALALTLVVVFVAQLIAAPICQRDELRTVLGGAFEEPVDVGLALKSLHAEGTAKQHRFARRRYEIVPAERGEIEQWVGSVTDFLDKRFPGEGARFLEAGKEEPEPVARLLARLQELQAIIDERAEVGATT